MLRKDSVRLTRRFDRIERGLQVHETERRRADARSAFGPIPSLPSSHPVSASLLFPVHPTHGSASVPAAPPVTP